LAAAGDIEPIRLAQRRLAEVNQHGIRAGPSPFPLEPTQRNFSLFLALAKISGETITDRLLVTTEEFGHISLSTADLRKLVDLLGIDRLE
jgi:hypothetical protein